MQSELQKLSQKADSLPDVMNVREVAAFLRVGTTVVYEAIRTERMPHVKVGRHIRVLRDQLLAWATNNGTHDKAGVAAPAQTWEEKADERRPNPLRKL